MEQDSQEKPLLSRRTIVAVAVILVLGSSVVATSYSLTYFQVCVSAPSVSFTVVMTDQGFNGSRAHTDPWPVLNVGRCARVTVHLVNQDTTEPHGFAITHYFDSGVQVRPGQTDDVTFNANRSGSFLIYCIIICLAHTYMQNGRLNVT